MAEIEKYEAILKSMKEKTAIIEKSQRKNKKAKDILPGLLANLQRADEIVRGIAGLEGEIRNSKVAEETEMLSKLQNSLIEQLNILNASIPALVSGKAKEVEYVKIKEEDRERFIKELEIEQQFLTKLKKTLKPKKGEKSEEEKEKSRWFMRMSSKLFSKISLKLSEQSSFKSINLALRKANMPYLLPTYLSMAFFSTLVALISLIILSAMVYTMKITSLSIIVSSMFIVLMAVFMISLTYPSMEASSQSSRISDELPFAAIHMSAIAGSGVEPTRVFKILARSPEYPYIGQEMKKLVNMVNFYGLNLTSALTETAKTTSSKKLAELLNGIALIITTGGNLQEYLNKVAADTLLEYKLSRRKYTSMAETYADIYTGLLIAAPLMFMLLIMMINLIGGSFGGMNAQSLSVIGIGAIILINIGFLIFLEVSTPKE